MNYLPTFTCLALAVLAAFASHFADRKRKPVLSATLTALAVGAIAVAFLRIPDPLFDR